MMDLSPQEGNGQHRLCMQMFSPVLTICVHGADSECDILADTARAHPGVALRLV